MMGLIHIYCGNGKGKTTAAVGLAVRAAGSGMKVHMVQLFKGSPTGELEILKNIPNITVERPMRNYGFTRNMSEEDKSELKSCHDDMVKRAMEIMHKGKADMIVIDEFFVGLRLGMLDEKLADELVFGKPKECELVLTGREPSEKYISAADYVSEINAVKHPFEKGITARKGIEF